ncbi:UDP-N-acetylmuramoyl-tripeptide--D-alanyl-D-alanine ligase [Polaribacter sp. R77954]|uniref:UDP-N-acetylmuramoyl-tripeptide--D-alanyl-D- alanine ligase n=1 Tax=Polaribacter sp. R77954 TaxID=3093870 RepID=UPI0037C80833
MKISEIYKLYKKHYLVDTDTRKIRKNTLFFALKGDHFNGNKFAEKALNLGAKYAIVDEEAYRTNENFILVDNVLNTLQKLANYHRKHLGIPIIALTGSNGKTTTKELINTVLHKKYNTVATVGNLNNHIGVPLTLLSMTPKHEMGIVEMGANHQKEIEFLSAICEPDYGFITNFGKAHLEGFGGVAGVIQGKSELYTFLKTNHKIAFVNPDDKIQIEKTKEIESIHFDLKNLKLLEVNPFLRITYKNTTIQSNLIGKYNFSNIAAAITIGTYFKVNEKAIKEAIESYIPKNNRSQIINKQSNTIILDAYNANPSSMKVALENFATLPHENKMVILGDMFELGTDSFTEHQTIINLCDSLQFSQQYFIGKNFYKCKTNKQKFETFADFENYIKKNPLKNLSILIKGSRGMQLERILDLIN